LEHEFRNLIPIACLCEKEEIDAVLFFSNTFTEMDFVEIGVNRLDAKRLVRKFRSHGEIQSQRTFS